MFIRPVANRLVPDPEKGGSLVIEGRTVEASNYWLRRIEDGDVVETNEPTLIEPMLPRINPKKEPNP